MHLRGHTLYSLVEPCVMCCGAVHWSRVDGVVFAVSQRALQERTGGTPKPSIRDLLPLGGGPLHVRGPFAQERGLEILGRYDFRARRV